MRYRVVSECVVEASSEAEARDSVTFDLDDGMREEVYIATVDELEPIEPDVNHRSRV